MRIIDFNSTKCRHCYKCVRNCAIKAISVLGGRAEIMEDHCILCGHCLAVCPQEAVRISVSRSGCRWAVVWAVGHPTPPPCWLR